MIGKGFKLAAGDGAGFGQLCEFSEGIGGRFGLMKGEGIQHFRFDFRIANGFNIFTREGRYDNGAVGNGVGNDTGGGEIRDGFNNGEVTVAGCGFIIDAERGCFGVREVIGRLNAQVYISFHTVFWQEIQSASMARVYSSDWPKTVRVTVAGLDGS